MGHQGGWSDPGQSSWGGIASPGYQPYRGGGEEAGPIDLFGRWSGHPSNIRDVPSHASKRLQQTYQGHCGRLCEGLKHFDKEGNGLISAVELSHLLTGLGEKVSEEEVELLIHGKENAEGNINYEGFVKMVLAQ